jgi:hypothetical protein
MRFEAASQDNGLSVLVAIAWPGLSQGRTIDFSVKEKDEASAPTVSGRSECLHSRFCPGVKVFSSLALVSRSKSAFTRRSRERSDAKEIYRRTGARQFVC